MSPSTSSARAHSALTSSSSDAASSLAAKIEASLNVLASHKATSAVRLEALRDLEEEFAQCVVHSSGPSAIARQVGTGHRNAAETEQSSKDWIRKESRAEEWWGCQKRARTCVALGLLAHVRVVFGELSRVGPRVEAEEGLALEIIACFAMLQGLALQDDESRHLCSRNCVLEFPKLLVDMVVGSLHSHGDGTTTSAAIRLIPQHAVDMIICIIVSTPSAPARFELLGGDTEIRHFLQCCREKLASASADEAETSLLGKCEELLLVHDFELERQERRTEEQGEYAATPSDVQTAVQTTTKTSMDQVKRVRGRVSDSFERLRASMLEVGPSPRQRDGTPLSDDSFRTAKESTSPGKKRDATTPPEVAMNGTSRQRTHFPHADTPERLQSLDRRATKTQEREARPRDRARDKRPKDESSRLDRKRTTATDGTTRATSPMRIDRGQRVPRQEGVGISSNSGIVVLSGDLNEASACFQRGRRPLVVMEELRDNSGLNTPSPQSPLKKIMGPSPAVKRAQARSVSPVKKEARLEAIRRRPESPTKRQ